LSNMAILSVLTVPPQNFEIVVLTFRVYRYLWWPYFMPFKMTLSSAMYVMYNKTVRICEKNF
jgi:hypothetical protein